MVPFAGYELPVLYEGENGGVMKEHLWCRSEGKASLFDVSHMGQVGCKLSRNRACLAPRRVAGNTHGARWYLLRREWVESLVRVKYILISTSPSYL